MTVKDRFKGAGFGPSAIVIVVISLFLVGIDVRASAAQATAIHFVQGSYSTPQTPQIFVSVPFSSAQSSGNLNVVIVGWNDNLASVASVTDVAGNTYIR